MVDKKVTQLNALAAASIDDLLYIIDAPGGAAEGKKITVANFLASFGGSNIALYKPYTFAPAPEVAYPDTSGVINTSGVSWNAVQQLTDGYIGDEVWGGGGYVGWLENDPVIRLDLGAAYQGRQFVVMGIEASAAVIYRPVAIKLEYSDDDLNWTTVVNRTPMDENHAATGRCISTIDISASGSHRYWRLSLTHDDAGNVYIFLSEILFYL